MVEILQKNNRLLRQISKSVPVRDIASPKIKKIIANMEEAMSRESDAVAIAAPQIGVLLRIFIVSRKVLAFQKKQEINGVGEGDTPPSLVCINPEIIKKSKKQVFMHEGCLSVRWLYGDVKRAEKVTIVAYDEKGKKFTRGGSGILAQIFQHEIEHLDGKLFIDKAKNIQEIPPENMTQEL